MIYEARVPTESHAIDIARVIQLSVAPVFLLTALGTMLSVLSGRLARIVDRARKLVERAEQAPSERAVIEEELQVMVRRRRLVNLAITSGTTAALLVCLLIASAFVGYLAHADFSVFLAVLFIAAMAAFVGALLFFLREIFIAVAMIRIELRYASDLPGPPAGGEAARPGASRPGERE
jgi:hypothetical protein